MMETLLGAVLTLAGLAAGVYAYQVSGNPDMSRFMAALVLFIMLVVSGVVLYADGHS